LDTLRVGLRSGGWASHSPATVIDLAVCLSQAITQGHYGVFASVSLPIILPDGAARRGVGRAHSCLFCEAVLPGGRPVSVMPRGGWKRIRHGNRSARLARAGHAGRAQHAPGAGCRRWCACPVRSVCRRSSARFGSARGAVQRMEGESDKDRWRPPRSVYQSRRAVPLRHRRPG